MTKLPNGSLLLSVGWSHEVVDDEGRIAGYGARFGNVDSHADVIDRGAFADTIANHKRNGTTPRMLLMHGKGNGDVWDSLPIGVWQSMHEDANGLWMEGRLADTQRGRDIHALLNMSPPGIDALSIGFRAKKFTLHTRNSAVRRTLHRVDLVETSLVTDPSNPLARILSVKSQHVTDAAKRFSDALERLAASMRQ